MFDVTDLNPRWTWRRRAFHEEELAGRAVWITLHHHCPILEVREQDVRDVEIVLNKLTLCDFRFQPEWFVEVGELNDLFFDLNVERGFVFRQFDVRD